MNKEVISGRQLLMLVFTFIIATATLFLPSFVTQTSGQDGWIAPLAAGGVGVIAVLLVTAVGLKYPDLTPIEYSELLLGKWFGKFIGLVYILFYLHLTAIITREVSITINANILADTSLEAITIILFTICAYAVKKGLEVITRLNILILFITYIAMFLCLAFLVKDMNLTYLQPILFKGLLPVLKDTVSPAGWFGEAASIAFILPFINKPKESRICSILGILWAALTLSVLVVVVLSIFGPRMASNLTFPTLEAVRIINIADYIQRAEIIFLIPWILANIIKICFFYYVTVLIVTKWFKLQRTTPLVLPVGLLIFSLSLSLFSNSIDLVEFLSKTWGFYSLTIELGIPLILLIASGIRRKGGLQND